MFKRNKSKKEYVLIRRHSPNNIEVGKTKYTKKQALKTLKAVKAIGVEMEIMRYDVAMNLSKQDTKIN